MLPRNSRNPNGPYNDFLRRWMRSIRMEELDGDGLSAVIDVCALDACHSASTQLHHDVPFPDWVWPGQSSLDSVEGQREAVKNSSAGFAPAKPKLATVFASEGWVSAFNVSCSHAPKAPTMTGGLRRV